MQEYLPEGRLYALKSNAELIASEQALRSTIKESAAAEAVAVRLDRDKNIHIGFSWGDGIIPFELSGIREPRLAASLIGKPVCFCAVDIAGRKALLSRKLAQENCRENYINALCAGDVIPATVTHVKPFGAFCDIGRGISALLPTGAISFSRITSAQQMLDCGDELFCVVKSVENGKILLSHKELLGNFLENAAKFHIGETVTGIVRSVADYGVFIAISPNLTGLSEPVDGIQVGDCVSVYIKNIIPEKLKVKLSVVGSASTPPKSKFNYFVTEGRLNSFLYSPAMCEKRIEVTF